MYGRRIVVGFLFLLLAVLSALAVYLWPDASEDSLYWSRLWRRTVYRLGFDLPGTPDLANLEGRLATTDLKLGAPVLLRIFKEEFELELWLERGGRFHHFATYPICRWSGRLGPKIRTGDRQAPEGFYSVSAKALNPNSRWHRSFNLGFPNAFDRQHRRTGSYLMVHGGCSSAGCYAMTNAVIDEIWRIVHAALNGGQKEFQVQIYPFRLTDANLERHAAHPQMSFWRQLKAGYDLFERERRPPLVTVCQGRYVFHPNGPEGGEARGGPAAKCAGISPAASSGKDRAPG